MDISTQESAKHALRKNTKHERLLNKHTYLNVSVLLYAHISQCFEMHKVMQRFHDSSAFLKKCVAS